MPGAFLTHAMWRAVDTWVFKHTVRIKLLIAALQDGTLRTRKAPQPGLRRGPAAAVAIADAPAIAVPRYFAWLTTVTQGRVPLPSNWMWSLLEEPEMLDLLAASPRLVRTMRPLCRALGVQLPRFPKPVAEPDAGIEPAASRAAPETVHVVAPEIDRSRVGGEVARFAAGDPRFRN